MSSSPAPASRRRSSTGSQNRSVECAFGTRPVAGRRPRPRLRGSALECVAGRSIPPKAMRPPARACTQASRHGGFRIGKVANAEGAGDRIHGAIGQRQALDLADAEIDAGMQPPRNLQHTRREVHADDPHPSRRLRGERAGAGRHIQEPGARTSPHRFEQGRNGPRRHRAKTRHIPRPRRRGAGARSHATARHHRATRSWTSRSLEKLRQSQELLWHAVHRLKGAGAARGWFTMSKSKPSFRRANAHCKRAGRRGDKYDGS